MKNILVYGDSNSFGHNTYGGERLTRDQRWPGILQTLLGDDYYVMERSYSGRTSIYDDPTDETRNGLLGIPFAVKECYPVDLVVIMLGTNDTKFVNTGNPEKDAKNIAYGVEYVVKRFRREFYDKDQKEPKFLMIAPPTFEMCPQFFRFTQEGADASRFFAEKFLVSAKNQKAYYLDAAPLCKVGPDMLHITYESHAALAKAVAELILNDIDW